MSPAAATIRYLRACQAARAAGMRVSYVTDPAWLLDMATNRRAGWPDDPTTSRGSARPLPDGRYPPKGGGDYYRHLRQLAYRINTPRLIVRAREVPARYRERLRARLTWPEGED